MDLTEKNRKEHKIDAVLAGSIAEELEIEPGDILLSVNGMEIADVFDYHYQMNEEYVTVLIRKPDGEEWELEIEKEYEEDIGIVFENGLMDDYRSCSNRCIFCFIDQMPPGMRKTLYFKDDDSRLSFLQGNYVTLTNMKEQDIDRIITYKLAPINISVQTMNPELRCRMLHNRFAGQALEKLRRLYEAGIEMNGQIVLCKGINDGEELERSIRELTNYIPHMVSVSIVPVGLTRYREGLEKLEAFTKEDACKVLQTVQKWQAFCMERWNTHFVHASDEWYLLADAEMPQKEQYDGYVQLENGVGMIRLLIDEFREALAAEEEGRKLCEHSRSGIGQRKEDESGAVSILNREHLFDCSTGQRKGDETGAVSILNREHSFDRNTGQRKGEKAGVQPQKIRISAATGMLAAPFIKMLAQEFMHVHPEKEIVVFAVRNDFFGEQITVSGLLTGQDILKQLRGRDLGSRLLLPCNLLRSGEDVFLDDMTVADLKRALQVEIVIVNSNGQDLYDAFSK